MDLKAEIEKLIRLQEIDLKLYELKQEKDINKPKQLQELKVDFEQKQQDLLGSEAKLKEIQLKKKEAELELATKEDNLRKFQIQLYQLKTNKEYQAKLTEIGALKADISVVEEDIIKILDEVDRLKKDFDSQKEQLQQEEKKYKNSENQLKEQIKDIEARLKNLQEKRTAFLSEINREIISRYEQLLKSRQGLALAEVKGKNCGSCHMIVTHQKVNEIKMYKNLVFCENCVRILYIPEDIS